MEKQFELMKTTRQNVLDFASKFTIEELNVIPPNFNNNIIWNVGHLIATQQVLNYQLSGLEFTVYIDFVERYRKGTKPEKFIGAEEWKFISEHLLSTIETTREDYTQKRFQKYRKYETSYGFLLEKIEDAISFINVHEGVHFGFIKAIGKVLGKS